MKKMSIKEVAEHFSLSADTLRFYEKKGLLGPIAKTNSGIRNYQEEDLKRIEFIKCMRSAQIPIETLKKYLDLFEQGDETLEERKQLLKKEKDMLKEKIDNMQAAYEKLTYKIDIYYSGKLDEYLKKKKENKK